MKATLPSMNTATKLNDWHELLSAVESNQGVHRVNMAVLRQLEGRQRVGKHILSAIEDKLATLGLGHLPQELPNRQQQSVLLYRFGSPASEVIQAVRAGLTEPASEAAYTYLHRLNSMPDPDTVVSKEEVGEAVENTARSVLELLRAVHTTEETVSVNGNGKTRVDIPELVKELAPVVSLHR